MSITFRFGTTISGLLLPLESRNYQLCTKWVSVIPWQSWASHSGFLVLLFPPKPSLVEPTGIHLLPTELNICEDNRVNCVANWVRSLLILSQCQSCQWICPQMREKKAQLIEAPSSRQRRDSQTSASRPCAVPLHPCLEGQLAVPKASSIVVLPESCDKSPVKKSYEKPCLGGSLFCLRATLKLRSCPWFVPEPCMPVPDQLTWPWTCFMTAGLSGKWGCWLSLDTVTRLLHSSCLGSVGLCSFFPRLAASSLPCRATSSCCSLKTGLKHRKIVSSQ